MNTKIKLYMDLKSFEMSEQNKQTEIYAKVLELVSLLFQDEETNKRIKVLEQSQILQNIALKSNIEDLNKHFS